MPHSLTSLSVDTIMANRSGLPHPLSWLVNKLLHQKCAIIVPPKKWMTLLLRIIPSSAEQCVCHRQFERACISCQNRLERFNILKVIRLNIHPDSTNIHHALTLLPHNPFRGDSYKHTDIAKDMHHGVHYRRSFLSFISLEARR